ncbi:hypothetical protein EMPG_10708 [Blastomyces silverae]|uniref:Uncharacterized protein n=1 Tax=Blastomyces silverae TaxID=2060906 RepID=A0A0H1B361_9EURO|nr:hypothetical protein EMPG_10708 [Blastomyces silverae]
MPRRPNPQAGPTDYVALPSQARENPGSGAWLVRQINQIHAGQWAPSKIGAMVMVVRVLQQEEAGNGSSHWPANHNRREQELGLVASFPSLGIRIRTKNTGTSSVSPSAEFRRGYRLPNPPFDDMPTDWLHHGKSTCNCEKARGCWLHN